MTFNYDKPCFYLSEESMSKLRVIVTLSSAILFGTSIVLGGLTKPALAQQDYICTNHKRKTWISPIDRTTSHGGFGTSCTLRSSSGSSSALREATLEARYPKSRIDVRNKSTTQSSVQYIGVVGDRVKILDEARPGNGYTWYQAKFDTGAKGWVRGDFISVVSSTPGSSRTRVK